MTYDNPFKQALRNLIKAHQLKHGLTQAQIALDLGFENPNYLSMIIGANRKDNLSALRLPDLKAYLGLSAEVTLDLVKARAALVSDDPKSKRQGMPLCSKTLTFVLDLQREVLLNQLRSSL